MHANMSITDVLVCSVRSFIHLIHVQLVGVIGVLKLWNVEKFVSRMY